MKRKLAGDKNIQMNELDDGSYQPISAYQWYGGYGSDSWYDKKKYSSSGSSSSSYSSSSSSSSSHKYATVWNKKVAGFTLSTFSADFKTLTTKFISYQGTVIHKFTVNKAGTVSSSGAGGWVSTASSLLNEVTKYSRKLMGFVQ